MKSQLLTISCKPRHFQLAVSGLLVLLAGCPSTEDHFSEIVVGSPEVVDAEPIRLVVDFGNGRKKTLAGLAWTDKMTVLDLLTRAAEHDLHVESRGSGTTAFVESIDGVAHERSGRNWIFSVNGKRAHVGADAYSLEPGDVVLWTFTEKQYTTDDQEANEALQQEKP